MALGNLLRRAGDMADKASSVVTDAAEKAMAAAKEKAADLSGDDHGVYESAIDAVGDAIADSGHMNSSIMTILQDLRDGNPYK